MQLYFKPLNWLSALDRGEEQPRADLFSTAGLQGRARAITKVIEIEERPQQQVSAQRSSPTHITAEAGQRAFDRARGANPDALYDELLAIAADELYISKHRLRRMVPNPFR